MENISVSVRVRPLNKQEEQEAFAWRIEGNSIVQLDSSTKDVDRAKDTKYVLDHVFGPDWTTEMIYEVTTQNLIHKIVNGFNSTVFAYGQTSSGKTHTMRGTADGPGIIPLAVAEAFKLIEMNDTREFLIRVSYMEIYNEDVNDLLAPENMKLPIHESKENGPYVAGLREDIVISPEQVLQLLATGEANRHTGSTKMNEKSSRSHTVFRMVVESRAVDAQSDDAGAVLVSTLSLVDLAGSERVAKSGAEGIRMKEGTAINKSLLTLGNVINKLSEGALATGSHIPYRDSKLTRILQPSLGGNAKTTIICAMTPAWCHREESHITLRFACRAKRVVNNAVVNEVLSDAAVLKRQAKEIEELKKKLAAGNGGGECADEHINGLRAQLLRSEQEMQLIKSRLAEEEQEKLKARKEAENTKKLFFLSRDEPSEGGSRKSNRRETWCPGKSVWAMPNAEASLSEAPTSSGGEPSQRKRTYGLLDGDDPVKGLTTLVEEEDENDDDAAEGPTPQRRRREYSIVSDYIPEDYVEDELELDQAFQRVMELLTPADQTVLKLYMERRQQDVEGRVEELERELMEQERVAAQPADHDGFAYDALVEQLELARWQVRQLEKKIEVSLQECHDEAVSTLRTSIDELQTFKTSLEEQLLGKDQHIAELQEGATVLRARIVELESLEAELQACAVAAQEKITHLEHTAETEAAAHEAALASLEQQHRDALDERGQAHNEVLATVNERCNQAMAAQERKTADLQESYAKLEGELRAAQERAEILVQTSLDTSRAATSAQAELQRQVAELSAKVQEAAGALKAKEELKEERQRSKQEIANLKSELQKLQQESKAGAKGKDLAQKDVDALKKRLTDMETKLRVAVQEKTTATFEKANLERQLKQLSQQLSQKKDPLDSKKRLRENIMVKSKQQLNSVEECSMNPQVETEKLQMDMVTPRQGSRQFQDSSSMQAEELHAALLASSLRYEALEKELTATRAQLKEAQALGATVTVACDATPSLPLGSMPQLNSEDELQRRLNELTAVNQELEETIFSLNELVDATQKEVAQLKLHVEAVDQELVQRCQQAAALQQHCDGLEEELALARQHGHTPGQQEIASGSDPSPEHQALEVQCLMTERDNLATQLADMIDTKEELKRNIAQQSQQRMELLQAISGLYAKLTGRQPDKHDLQVVALLDAEAQGQVAQLQAAASNLIAQWQQQSSQYSELKQQFGELQQQFGELQQQYNVQQQEYSSIQVEVMTLRACSQTPVQRTSSCMDVLVRGDADPGGGMLERETLGAQIAELLQQQAELKVEMSDVQAACNVAIAEKHTFERAMTHRVLELETANLRLQDELTNLRAGQPALPAYEDRDSLPVEHEEGMRRQLHHLHASLESITKAKEDACQCLEAELGTLRLMLANAESTIAQLQEKVFISEAEKLRCTELQDALTAATMAQTAELVGDLEGKVSNLDVKLNNALAELSAMVSSRDAVTKQLAEAEATASQRQEQVLSLHLTVEQLAKEVKDATQSAASLDAEVQELLDANSLLESEVRDLRAQLSTKPSDREHTEVAALTKELRESKANLVRLEQQMVELSQQYNDATAKLRDSDEERLELESIVKGANKARAQLESRLDGLIMAHKELQESNVLLENELQATGAQLHSAENRHWAAIEKLQEENMMLQKHLCDARGEAIELDAASRRNIKELMNEITRLQDAQVESKLVAEQREAELNAQQLALQSQIHWLNENQRPRAPPPPAAPHADERIRVLEDELRRTKRAEIKLQGLLFRIRKDVEDSKSGLNIQNLLDERSLQYDVDRLTHKCERLQREISRRDAVEAQLRAQLDELEQQRAELTRGTGLKSQVLPSSVSQATANVLADKENMLY